MNRALNAYPAILFPFSPVELKSSREGDISQMRVVAKVRIESGEKIYQLFGIMAADNDTEHSMLSAISKRHSGGLEPRLLVGPIRFINSDCKPNAYVSILINYANSLGAFR